MNNREIATLIWVAGFLIWAFRFRQVRESFGGVVHAASHPKILVPFLLAVVYVMTTIAVLAQVGMWAPGQTKDAAMWFVFTAIATSFGLINKWRGESILRHSARDAILIVVVIEFLTSTYTFALPWELALVPLLAFLGALDGVTGDKPGYASVKRLVIAMQVGVGLLIVGFAVREAVLDWRSLNNLDTVRSLLLAPMLSVLFVPFTYMLLLYVTYENLFLRLTLPGRAHPGLLSYAKRQIIRRFGPRLYSLKAFAENDGRRLWSIQSTSDIDLLLRQHAVTEKMLA